jgi:hypothetical protein
MEINNSPPNLIGDDPGGGTEVRGRSLPVTGRLVRVPPEAVMSVPRESCVVQRDRPLRSADPLSMGVLPSVFCVIQTVAFDTKR